MSKKENLTEVFKQYKLSAKKLRTVICLLIIQIITTLLLVGVENWIVIIPQLLELIVIIEKIDTGE